jgi:hypothetical protein
MHDPEVVAFEIPWLWPQRSSFPKGDNVRWRIRLHHDHFEDETHSGMCDGCDQPMTSKRNPFPWWRPRSYSKFWCIAGHDFYWRSFITVWHVEPGGHDALSICRSRYQDKTGKWHLTTSWKWHFWHYHVQIPPLQHLRRYLFTRCEVCGGKSRKGHMVNRSHSWYNKKSPWWKGETGLSHMDCDRAGL